MTKSSLTVPIPAKDIRQMLDDDDVCTAIIGWILRYYGPQKENELLKKIKRIDFWIKYRYTVHELIEEGTVIVTKEKDGVIYEASKEGLSE